jgi:hypothetical protein
MFTTVDIFSLIGGFLGLFAGFSFLSAGEIILHFIVNPLITIRHRRSTKVHATEITNTRQTQKQLWNYVINFLVNSSIHSFSHVGNRQKKFLER